MSGPTSGQPPVLSALRYTHDVAEKKAAVGFDWPDVHGVLAKVDEELAELRAALATGDPAAIGHEYGDLLMATATIGRHIGHHPEDTLHRANERFLLRFSHMESIARARGLSIQGQDAATLESWWQEAKRELAEAGPGDAPSPPQSA